MSFTLPASPSKVATFSPAHSASAGVVGEIVAAGRERAAVRVEQGGEGEGLRRLHQRAAARGRCVPVTRPAASTVLTVSATAIDRHRRAMLRAPPRSRARSARPTRTAAPRRAPARCPGESGASASRPARTEACRVAPPATGGRRGEIAEPPPGRGRNRPGERPAERRKSPGACASSREARPDHRLAQDGAILLGHIAAGAQPTAGCHDNGCDHG